LRDLKFLFEYSSLYSRRNTDLDIDSNTNSLIANTVFLKKDPYTEIERIHSIMEEVYKKTKKLIPVPKRNSFMLALTLYKQGKGLQDVKSLISLIKAVSKIDPNNRNHIPLFTQLLILRPEAKEEIGKLKALFQFLKDADFPLRDAVFYSFAFSMKNKNLNEVESFLPFYREIKNTYKRNVSNSIAINAIFLNWKNEDLQKFKPYGKKIISTYSGAVAAKMVAYFMKEKEVSQDDLKVMKNLYNKFYEYLNKDKEAAATLAIAYRRTKTRTEDILGQNFEDKELEAIIRDLERTHTLDGITDELEQFTYQDHSLPHSYDSDIGADGDVSFGGFDGGGE
jgi:hypothetical protein